MRAHRPNLSALVPVWLVLLMLPALCSCSVSRQARDAGEAAFDGAKDAAAAWWETSGKAQAEALARRAAMTAAEKRRAELAGKVADGTATPWELALLGLLTAATTAYSAYQRGHRTGENQGWTDATKPPTPPGA